MIDNYFKWNVIEQIKHAKFLGIYIDERLHWDEHIKQVAGKISQNLGALRRLVNILTYYKWFTLS